MARGRPSHNDAPRDRFNGGRLGTSHVDRTVAQFVDDNPGDAWGIMKQLVYAYYTGKLAIYSGDSDIGVPLSHYSNPEKALGEIASALGEFDV